MTFFVIVISIVIIQRLAELALARRNARRMIELGAIEYDAKGYTFLVIMHVCFFLFLIIEFFAFKRSLNTFWYLFAVIFLITQALRYWAISSLGFYWNTRIIVLKGSALIDSGPYKYIRHPNYTAVAIELAVLPLIFSCYITSAVFSLLNLIALNRRIKIENEALKKI
jgi:methyltransferase